MSDFNLDLPQLSTGWSWRISDGYLWLDHRFEESMLKRIPTDRNGLMSDQAISKTAYEMLQEYPEYARTRAWEKYYEGTYEPGRLTKPPTRPDVIDLNTVLPPLNPGWSWKIKFYITVSLELREGFYVRMKRDVKANSLLHPFGVMSKEFRPEYAVKTAEKMLREYPAHAAKQKRRKPDTRFDGIY